MLQLTLLLAIGQPDVDFARGVESRADATAARPHFIEAAKGYDAEWKGGNRSPALATNRSRAHGLAGDLPGAILAAREGLQITPYDPTLRQQLETLRDAVRYPPDLRPPPMNGWRTRISPWDLFLAATAGCLFVAVGLSRRLTTRDGWATPIAVIGVVVILTVVGIGWQLHHEAAAEPPVLVLIRPTVLRTGNGDTYPPRTNDELPRGAEANERHRRGGWVQVELPNGVLGWLPEENAIAAES